MADQATPLKAADPAAAPLNTATISGRVTTSRLVDGVTYTELKLPAPDEYSHPQTIEIRSKRSLGRDGDNVTVGVRIGGFKRTFDRKPDPRTGEIDKGSMIRNTLEAIE